MFDTLSSPGHESANYHGHKLQPRPPADGINLSAAGHRFRLAVETIWKLVDEGQVKAGIGKRKKKFDHNSVLVSVGDLERVTVNMSTRFTREIAEHPPADGVPVNQLEKELGLGKGVLRQWCDWPKHPGLGRPMRKGIGPYEIAVSDGRRRQWRGLLVSRADATACADALRNPLNRPFPRNPGQWIAPGIFRHTDGGIYFAERYVYDHRPRFGMANRTLSVQVYSRQLDALKVTWPGSGPRDRWTRTVFSEASLDRLVAKRGGKLDGGNWLVHGDIWADSEGLWYSSRWIGQQTGHHTREMHSLLRSNGTVGRYKEVPLGNATRLGNPAPTGRKKGGRSPVVHHESEVRPLLGIGGAVPTVDPATGAPAKKKRGRQAGVTIPKGDATREKVIRAKQANPNATSREIAKLVSHTIPGSINPSRVRQILLEHGSN